VSKSLKSASQADRWNKLGLLNRYLTELRLSEAASRLDAAQVAKVANALALAESLLPPEERARQLYRDLMWHWGPQRAKKAMRGAIPRGRPPELPTPAETYVGVVANRMMAERTTKKVRPVAKAIYEKRESLKIGRMTEEEIRHAIRNRSKEPLGLLDQMGVLAKISR
jgi:hypothetical protein